MQFELRPFRNRLAQFKPWTNSSEDWDKLWSGKVSRLREHLTQASDLGEYEIFTRYLPNDLPVLEAGCGLGTILAALVARGYKAEGLDYADVTIRRLNEAAPHLNVRVGDIYHLDVPDQTYGGYISLGVLEHNPDGPLDGLREARRVLHPRGVAIFTIPFLNAKRARIVKRKQQDGNSPELPKGFDFYQFYFSPEDFTQYLNIARFRVVELFPFSVEWGLSYDYPWVDRLRKRHFFHWRLHKLFLQCCRRSPRAIRQRYAHMMMYICRPV